MMPTTTYTDKDVARFSAKVQIPAADDITQPCWTWVGAKHSKNRGYGKFRLGGRVMNAHKAAYLLFIGDVEAGKVLGHQCNNEQCSNPFHLKPESQSENMKYCVASGRHNSQH